MAILNLSMHLIFTKNVKKNDNVQEFINNIPLIREKIYNEHNKICELLKKKNKEEKAIRYVEYLDKIKNDKLKKETLNSKIKDEMNLVKELLRESKMIEFMNKPNYIQNSYNDCYTINVPYKHNAFTEVVEFKDIVPGGNMGIMASVNCSELNYIRISVAGHGSAMFYFQDEFRQENNISDILSVSIGSSMVSITLYLKDAIYETAAGVKNLDIIVVFG